MSTAADVGSTGRLEMERSYEPYSDDPDYIEANRSFVRELPLGDRCFLLDLACGIGTLTRLALEVNPRHSIVGVDLSYEGLRIARRRLESARWLRVGLVTATADVLPLADQSMDAVLMGHSIHMLSDERRLLSEIRRATKPGGIFAFNTSFYAGTFVPGTEGIYHDWTMRAIRYVRDKDREMRERGEAGVRRTKGSAPGAFSRPWLSPEEWIERLDDAGFDTESRRIRTVPLTQRSFEAIGAYAGFAQVLLSGYPVELACEALQAAAAPTFAAAGIDEVPRNWLEVVATSR